MCDFPVVDLVACNRAALRSAWKRAWTVGEVAARVLIADRPVRNERERQNR